MLPYKIHKFDGMEFELAKQIPAYLTYCDYDYCWQEYKGDRIPIPVQTFFRFSEPAYLKDGYYRRYYKKFDLERTRNYRYFKNRDVCVYDAYQRLSDKTDFERELTEYTRGFLEGYNDDFVPYVDTPQARIEMVMQAATVRPEFVSMSTNKDGDRLLKFHCVYSQGLVEGKRYKAWGVIEQTPSLFASLFIDNTTQPKPEENKKAVPILTDAMRAKIANMQPAHSEIAKKMYQFLKEYSPEKNPFKKLTEDEYLLMVAERDFSSLNLQNIKHRVAYIITLLNKTIGEDWGNETAQSIGFSDIRACQKSSGFNDKRKFNKSWEEC